MLRTDYKQNFFFSALENILPFLSEPGYLLNLLFNLYYFKYQMCSTYQHFLLFTLAEIHFVLLVYFLNSTLDQNFREKLLAFISPAK